MKCGAVILAAGQGSRFHGKKQFFEFMGKPLWRHVYDKAKRVMQDDENIAVVGVEIEGGETRSESVQNGLHALKRDTQRVIILEAARPLVTEEQIRLLLTSEAPSQSFVMPLVDTVIMRDGTYLDRDKMYDLLTPQAFDYQKLLAAYETGRYENMTDETRVMYEEYGIQPLLTETSDNLIKVTYRKDIYVIRQMAEERNGED